MKMPLLAPSEPDGTLVNGHWPLYNLKINPGKIDKL